MRDVPAGWYQKMTWTTPPPPKILLAFQSDESGDHHLLACPDVLMLLVSHSLSAGRVPA